MVTVKRALFVCLVYYCPESIGFTYTAKDGNRSCLKLMTAKTDWHSASNECAAQHEKAHLVVINTNKKKAPVKKFIQGEDITSYRRYWKIYKIQDE